MYSSSRSFSEFIKLKFDWEDFHRWKDAPDEVAFLKNWHRHRFYAEVEMEVKHDDRELEFFMVLNVIKREILPFINGSEEISSCEQKAKYIADGLLNTYGEDRELIVTVYEDNENGGGVSWTSPRRL